MIDQLPIAIDSLPYWRVSIRPSIYREDRIENSRQCLDVLESTAVRAGGWRYPFVSRDRDETRLRNDHAEAWIDSGEFREFSRLYRSAQLLYVTVLREAFIENELMQEAARIYRLSKPRGSTEARGCVHIVRLMRLVSVAFLNAAALVERLSLSGKVGISFKIANIRGYVLVAGPLRELDEYYQSQDDTVDVEREYRTDSLQVDPLAPAIDIARELYSRFGWLDPLEHVLLGIQEEALR